MKPRWFAVAFVTTALLSPPAQSTASDSHLVWDDMKGEFMSRSRAAQFARWLTDWPDVVFLGRFESWVPNPIQYAGAAVVSCRIDSLVSGYWPDSIVSFSQISRPYFSPELLRPGTRLLGWLTRRCGPSPACGAFNVLGWDGVLLHDYSDSDDARALFSDPRPLRWQDLPLEVLRANVISSIDGAGGMAIATFRPETKLPTAEIVVRCVDPKWVIPSATSLPALAKFHRLTNSCSWEGAPTRYLLPIPVGYKGDTLTIKCCPNRLRVKDGRVLAFDLPLDSLSSVIGREDGGGLRVREPAWVRSGRR